MVSVESICEALRVRVAGRIAAGTLQVTTLARRSGVSQPLLSNWVAGRRRLSVSSVDAVRVAAGVAICELTRCPCGEEPAVEPLQVRAVAHRRPWRRRIDPIADVA